MLKVQIFLKTVTSKYRKIKGEIFAIMLSSNEYATACSSKMTFETINVGAGILIFENSILRLKLFSERASWTIAVHSSQTYYAA